MSYITIELRFSFFAVGVSKSTNIASYFKACFASRGVKDTIETIVIHESGYTKSGVSILSALKES